MRLDHLVRKHARTSPERLAVSGADGDYTYARLDSESDRAARGLAELGVQRHDRVALWLPKGVRTVVAMQAALRLGAAYVPIDPLVPGGRAAQIIRDCAARVVVTTPDQAKTLI